MTSVIISRTPFRISFFGGGTDYPRWYRGHGGAVLATSIDKYCYLTCRYLPPFFEHRIRLIYRRIETCHSVDQIAHPTAREVLRYLKIDRGLEIHHDADLPARSGMGSSSSFTVGLLHALHALKGWMPSKQELAAEGIYIEQQLLKEIVGSQDQVTVAYGGLNHITFLQNGEISVRPVTVAQQRVDELSAHLMLFFTGIQRTASDLAESYVADIEKKEKQLRALGQMVSEGLSILNSGRSITEFGKLLHQSWLAKRSLGRKVSNSHVETIYREALAAGAVGGKLTGAGGGGFILLFVPPSRKRKVMERLDKLLCVPFKFEFSGSQIIFFDPEEDYAAQEKARASQRPWAFRELKLNRRKLASAGSGEKR